MSAATPASRSRIAAVRPTTPAPTTRTSGIAPDPRPYFRVLAHRLRNRPRAAPLPREVARRRARQRAAHRLARGGRRPRAGAHRHLRRRAAAPDRAPGAADARVERRLPRRAGRRARPRRPLAPAAPPPPLLSAPDGRTFRWDDPALPGALRDDLGRPVRLERDGTLMPDVPHTPLVPVEASRVALERELGRPIDPRRFRPNLHVRLDTPAFAEEGWTGGRVRVGEAELELLDPCERCAIPTRDPDTTEKWPELLRRLAADHDTLFGIYARPLRPATVRAGDAVVVA